MENKMDEQLLYRKLVTPGGRVRYVPTHIPSYEGLGKGAYLYMITEEMKSRIEVLNPAKAELLAAAQIMRRGMLAAMAEACRHLPDKSFMDADELVAWEAYAAEMGKRGKDPRPLVFEGISLSDVVDAGINALMKEMENEPLG